MKKLAIAISIAAAITVGGVNAEEREIDDASMVKILDDVFLSERRVVIDDTVYHLSLNLVVTGDPTSNTEFALKKGRKVQFVIDPQTETSSVKSIRSIHLIDD